MTNTHGSCLCGDLRFEAQLPSKWVAHCHCSMCRRAHGAPLVTWVGLKTENVRIVDPQSRLRWYASSPGAGRGFCDRCGTTLFFRSERWPGELHVVRSNFDGPLDREPQVHVSYDNHVSWLQIGEDGLKRLGDFSA
ncbi:GFA family protein [Arenimonas daejeonensis]|uniref:GFA family protein n=1 Tax=Arenimonas daejeonensis TaxID=370777 RepID=UPI0011BDD06D|nr:GFA family protein [Arenimonas daejeonensis]